MPPAPSLFLSGPGPFSSTFPSPSPSAPMFIPPPKIKVASFTSSTTPLVFAFDSDTIKAPAPTPTSGPSYPAPINWTPSLKFGIFCVSAVGFLLLFFLARGLIRRIKGELKRATERGIHEAENRRQEVVMQWQSEQSAEFGTHSIGLVAGTELGSLHDVSLASQDNTRTKQARHMSTQKPSKSTRVAGEGQQEEGATEGKYGSGDSADTKGDMSFETTSSSGSGSAKSINTSQASSHAKPGASSPKSLSSDDVLRGVNALGYYEPISASQRAKERAKSLKALEGR